MFQPTTPVCLVKGSINIDIFCPLPHIVLPGQTISTTAAPTTRLGGKGANVALACALAGAEVVLDACVGGDAEGEGVIKDLARDLRGEEKVGTGEVSETKERIEPEGRASRRPGRIRGDRLAKWDGGQTGKALIQVGKDGQNAIILIPGANFAPDSAKAPLEPLISPQTTHLIVANEIPLRSTVEYLLATHQSSGIGSKKVTSHFNPSPMLPREEIRKFPWHAVTWLIVNEGELKDIAVGLQNGDNDDSVDVTETDIIISSERLVQKVQQALTRIAARHGHEDASPTSIICTLGPSGVLYTLPPSALSSAPGNTTSTSTPPTIRQLPAARLLNPLIDTTGAGDCFLGYFVAGLMALEAENRHVDESGLKEVITRCLTASAMCVEREGAQDSYATIGEVEVRLAELRVE